MKNYTITGFSDEISADLDTQLRTLNQLGVKYMEIRGLNGKGAAELTEEEALAVRAKLDTAGIQVSALGSPIGKIGILEDFAPHFELFKNAVSVAKCLGTQYIRLFSFFIPKGEDPANFRGEVLARLRTMIAYAKEQHIILLHENEKDIYGDTAPRCLDLMQALSCKNFCAIFDFANFVQCAQSTLAAYESLAPYIAYIHIKDAVGARVVPAGMGQGNLREILKSLYANGYAGFLSLEPHLTAFAGFTALENSRETDKKLDDGAFAWQIALAALKAILYDMEAI